MNKNFLTIILFIISFSFAFAQEDIQIGGRTSSDGPLRYNGGVFDYSDPSTVNIKVQLWGYIKFPGYYIVPAGIGLNELISFAGGPTQDALLDDIRITKIKKDNSSSIMKKYNYNDLMWNDNLEEQINFITLEAGDMVIIPGKPRYFFRENLSFYVSMVTAISSIAALIISLTN